MLPILSVACFAEVVRKWMTERECNHTVDIHIRTHVTSAPHPLHFPAAVYCVLTLGNSRGATRSTIGGEGGGCHNFVPVLGGNGTKIAPPGDLFDQPPGEMS